MAIIFDTPFGIYGSNPGVALRVAAFGKECRQYALTRAARGEQHVS